MTTKTDPIKTDDRPWKMRTIFDKLSDSYTKYYSPTGHLAVMKSLFFLRAGSFSSRISESKTTSLE